MAGPPPAIGPVVFRAVRATAYDLPEDFVTRLEPGIDEPARASLVNGPRVLQQIRHLWTWTIVSSIAGALELLVVGLLRTYVLAIGGVVILACEAAFFVYLSALAISHRDEIHRVEAFAEATRRSFLPRDIA